MPIVSPDRSPQTGLKSSSWKPPLRRMPRQHSLSINLGGLSADPSNRSSKSPRSPRSPPRALPTRSRAGDTYAEGYDIHLHSPITSLPTPPSPRSPKQRTKSIFSGKLAKQSISKISKADPSAKPPSDQAATSTRQTSQVYQYRKSPGSTPELSLLQGDGVPRSGMQCTTPYSSHTKSFADMLHLLRSYSHFQ